MQHSDPDMHKISVYGHRHRPPQAMPGGWWDALTTLAEWVMEQLRRAYEAGYWDGRLDGAVHRRSDAHLTERPLS